MQCFQDVQSVHYTADTLPSINFTQFLMYDVYECTQVDLPGAHNALPRLCPSPALVHSPTPRTPATPFTLQPQPTHLRFAGGPSGTPICCFLCRNIQ